MVQDNEDQILTGNLRADVEGAFLLLSYAAQSGLEIKIETAKTITKAKMLLKAGQLSGDEEALFYLSYEEIAKLVRPVTVDGLNAAPEARRTVNKWFVLPFFICLVFLLAVQIYWLIGSTAYKNVKEARNEIETVNKELEAAKKRSPGAKETPEISKLIIQIENIQNRQAMYYDILMDWIILKKLCLHSRDSMQSSDTGVKNPPPPDKDAKPATGADVAKDKQLDTGEGLAWADFILTVLQGYLLPLLYGLLGAYTYILRMLSSEIRNLTYTGKSRIRYYVRAVLGMQSGLAITWFIQPDAAILKSLSSLAIAFLAGYSVEILFAAMDKFVGAFSGKEPAQAKTT